jgi:hypothetical protein
VRAKKQWEGLSFWAKGELNSKGVAVLSRRNLDIAIRKVEDEGDGLFLKLDCMGSEFALLMFIYRMMPLK